MNKILISDEEKWYLDAVTDRIDAEFGEGYYDFVSNGYETLNLIKKNNYKLLILDMMMPLGGDLELPKNEPNLMYGIYILRLVRQEHKNLPVVCYTILDDNKTKKQIQELNAIHICKLDENAYERLFYQINNYMK